MNVKLMANTSEGNEITREQIRGLYVIGLLAVLVAVKVSSQLDPLADFFFFYVMLNWVGYAFCMVLAYLDLHESSFFGVSKSTSERISSSSKTVGKMFLVASLIGSAAFFIWYIWYILLFLIFVVGISATVYYLARTIWRHFKTSRKV
jgi:hypothetical protein